MALGWLRRGAQKPAAQKRVLYRVRQFLRALLASLRPLDAVEQAKVRAVLGASAWPLFAAMPRSDQRHSLNVLRAIEQNEAGGDPGLADVNTRDRRAGSREALLQAALLHDCAKRAGGVRLWHRVAVVLLKGFCPAVLQRWGAGPAPAWGNWRYPFWAHVNHPSSGASLAAQAGCPPLAVWLIRHHQGAFDPAAQHPLPDDGSLAMLAVLQAADDGN